MTGNRWHLGLRRRSGLAALVLLLSLGSSLAAATFQGEAPAVAMPAGAYRTRNVFVVCIDGLRGTEAFDAEDPAQYIPHMWNDLRPLGSLYTNFYNLGATWTTPGNDTIVDGCWEITPNNENWRDFRPACPTMFEYYRRANPELPQSKVWAVVGKNNLHHISASDHPLYGPDYAASLDSPRGSDRDDSLTWSQLQQVMERDHPSLVFLHLGGVDHAGHKQWTWYLQAIREADKIVNDLWDQIQHDPDYRDQTTLLVTTDHGRHDDAHGGFRSHGGICQGCQRLFLLALGPDIRAGAEFSELRQQIDICPTVGELLGFETPLAAGRMLREMLVEPATVAARHPGNPPAQVAWQDETQITHSTGFVEQPDVAVSATGLHVAWVDDRSGGREIYYKARSATTGQWSSDEPVSSSGIEARAPSIAVDGDSVHVVWQQLVAGNWLILHRQRAGDGTWSEPDVVMESVVEGWYTRCQQTWEPEVAVCQGQLLVAIPVSLDRLYVLRRPAAGGSWTSYPVVNSPETPYEPGFARVLPQAVAVASGGSAAYAFWQQAWQGTSKSDWTLSYSRSLDGGAVWSSPTRLTYAGGAHDVTVAANGRQVLAAWLEPPHTLKRIASGNLGGAWGTVETVRTSGAWNPDLAAAPGILALAWEDYATGRPIIYLSRSATDGATWVEQRLSFGDSLSIEPAVATDGATAYVVWRDRRDGSWQLYLGQSSDTAPAPTPSPTATATATCTATPTSTPEPTATPKVTATPTSTVTLTATCTETPSVTTSPTTIMTDTATPTATEEHHVLHLPIVLR